MKFGVREVTDIVLKATADGQTVGNKKFAKGQPVLAIDSAKTSTVETSSTTVYAEGGRGNPKRVAWDGEKNLTFTFEDALITPTSAAILMGAGGKEQKRTYQQHVFGVVSVVNNKLDASDLLNADLFRGEHKLNDQSLTGWIIAVGEDGDFLDTVMKMGEGSKIDDIKAGVLMENGQPKTGDGSTGILKNGARYYVDFYAQFATGEGAQQILITPDNFAGTFYIEGSTLWRREDTGMDVPAQLTIPKGKVQTSATLTMANSGDPSTFTFTVDAMPGYVHDGEDKKVLMQIDLKADK